MTAKRNSPARRPAKPKEWTIKHASREAAEGWENLCQQQSGVIATMYDSFTVDPRRAENRDRQGPLKGALAVASINGGAFDQWQYEIAGGGRVWYAIDDARRLVWITKASARHPNETK